HTHHSLFPLHLTFSCISSTFFFNDTAPTDIYTLSLHDALPISELERLRNENAALKKGASSGIRMKVSEKGAVSIYGMGRFPVTLDRKSTRLNSSHVAISYAVFCLKKKRARLVNGPRPSEPRSTP